MIVLVLIRFELKLKAQSLFYTRITVTKIIVISIEVGRVLKHNNDNNNNKNI